MAEEALSGYRVHVYPLGFADRPAVLSVPVAAEDPAPASSGVPAPVVSDSAIVAPPRRGRRGLLLSALFLFLLTFGGAAAYYVYVVLPTQELAPTPVDATPEPAPVTPEPVQPPPPATPIPGTDTDSDGLTNVEELLYRTDFRNPDTDGDTYLDGNEVFHRYHPNGLAPATLLDTGAVTEYTDGEGRFGLLYPATWRQDVDTAGTVTFTAPSLAAFSVEHRAKDAAQTLEVWYDTQTDLPNRNAGISYVTKTGFKAVGSEDDRMVVLDAGDHVWILRYTLMDTRTVEYLQTFKMFVNSLSS